MVENVIQIKSETTIHVDVSAKIQENNVCKKDFSSLPNRHDFKAINLRIFRNHIPGTMFIKIKESSSSASHTSAIPATTSLEIRKRFRFSHKSVKIKLLNTDADIYCNVLGLMQEYQTF